VFEITWIKRQLDVLCFKSLKIYLHYSALHVSDIIMSIIRSFSAAHAVSGHVWCLVRCVLQRLHVQLRSSWWWTQWCPKHVERNNVNTFLRILKQSTSSWRFYSKLLQRCTEPWTWNLVFEIVYMCLSWNKRYGHRILWPYLTRTAAPDTHTNRR